MTHECMYTSVEDTIVAVSSARGHGERGIVRLSGPQAIALAGQLFRSGDGCTLDGVPGFRFRSGEVVFDEVHRVAALAYLFRQPYSYTRQDIVELHTIGSPPLLDMIVERCTTAGARLAEPGEFTARAFLAGSLNLAQAEAVAATIQARSDDQLRAARRMMQGEIFERVKGWKNELADLLSLVVADIDFAEERMDFISPQLLVVRLGALQRELLPIVESAGASQRLDVLPHVLLLGPPNAGKSTLMNALSGMNRAIVSAVSGTTRDILAAPVRLIESEAMLLDAAGVDEDPDEIVAQARQRAIDAASAVDLMCMVFDASRPVDRSTVSRLTALADAPAVIAANKTDTLAANVARRRCAELASFSTAPVCPISALRGDGLGDLRAELEQKLTHGCRAGDDAGIVINSRQRGALAGAAEALNRAVALAEDAADVVDAAELIALELRESLDCLNLIGGPVTTEDLLGRIFASFCIGK